MSKLAEILKSIEDNNKTIEIEHLLDEVPYRSTRSGWQSAINEARENNAKLKANYRKEALANSLAMFVYGPTEKTDAFLAIAKEEGNVFTVRADGMYRDIANKLEEGVGSHRILVTGQVQDLVGYVISYADKYGLLAFNRIDVENDVSVPTYEDTVSAVRDKVRHRNGDDFTRLYVSNTFSDELLASSYKGTVVPVVVVVRDEAEAMALSPLFAKSGGTYDLTDVTVDKEYVLGVFQETKPTTKKRKNSQ